LFQLLFHQTFHHYKIKKNEVFDMGTKAGVGFSENPKSFEAGVEAAKAAVEEAGVDKERGGLIMFEPDLKVGTEVQLMRRSFSDFEYVRKYSKEILKRNQDRNPFFCFYIDCAGRASAYSGTEGEEAEEVQKVIGSQMPLLGVYSGTEICKVGSVVQPCVFTGILCVFSE
jgi:hypothetical protein